MQISRRAQGRNFILVHAYCVPDCRRIPPHTQRVAVNVHMLHINGSRESFQSVVIKTMQRCHQAQVFRNSLGQSLRERVVLDGERNIVAQQIERLQSLFVVGRVAIMPAEGNCPNQLSRNFQRRHAFEQLGRHVSIRAQKSVVRGFCKKHRALRGAERMHLPR